MRNKAEASCPGLVG